MAGLSSRGILATLFLALLLAACGEAQTSTPSANNAAVPVATIPAGGIIPTAASNNTNTGATTTTAAAVTAAAITAAGAAGGSPKKGGSITTAVSGDAKTIHPYKKTLSIDYEYSGFLFSALLTQRDPKTLAVIGNAAKSWEVDPTTATVTFKLRDGLTWSDGKPITSNDYVWTWQQATKKENGWAALDTVVYNPEKPLAQAIESYTAPDPTTLKVKLHGTTFNIVEAADQVEPLPRHIWEGKDWNDPTKNPEIEKPSVVSGPWLEKEWVHDNHFTLVRNEKSTVFQVPQLDSITYTVVPNASIGFQKLKNGELDFYKPAEQDEQEAEKAANLNTYKWVQASGSFDYIGFNFRKPYLQDRSFRQALNYALDKKTMINKVVFNLGAPIASHVVPASVFYNDSVEKYDYNLDKAKKLLADAGYTLKDGKLLDAKGQPLPKLKFRHNVPNAVREKTAAVVQEQWKQLGLEVEAVTSDLGTMNKALASEPYDYDFWIANWSPGLNPEDFGGIWKTIPQQNRGNWVNTEVNKLYDDAVKELDFNKRKDIMNKIQVIEATELPYIFYYARLNWLSVNNKLAGLTQSSLGTQTDLLTGWYFK